MLCAQFSPHTVQLKLRRPSCCWRCAHTCAMVAVSTRQRERTGYVRACGLCGLPSGCAWDTIVPWGGREHVRGECVGHGRALTRVAASCAQSAATALCLSDVPVDEDDHGPPSERIAALQHRQVGPQPLHDVERRRGLCGPDAPRCSNLWRNGTRNGETASSCETRGTHACGGVAPRLQETSWLHMTPGEDLRAYPRRIHHTREHRRLRAPKRQ